VAITSTAIAIYFGEYGERLKSVKKNAALLHFLAFGAFDLLTFFGHKKGRPTGRIPL
jgi:hypothetical protein